MAAYYEAEQTLVYERFAAVGLRVLPYVILRVKDLCDVDDASFTDGTNFIASDTTASGPFLQWRAGSNSYTDKINLANRYGCPVMIDMEPQRAADAAEVTAYNNSVAHVAEYLKIDCPNSRITLYDSPVRQDYKVGEAEFYGSWQLWIDGYTDEAYSNIDFACLQAYQSSNLYAGYEAQYWVEPNVATAVSIFGKIPSAQVWAEAFDTDTGNYSYPSNSSVVDDDEIESISDELVAAGVLDVYLFARVDSNEYTSTALDNSFARMRMLLEPFAEVAEITTLTTTNDTTVRDADILAAISGETPDSDGFYNIHFGPGDFYIDELTSSVPVRVTFDATARILASDPGDSSVAGWRFNAACRIIGGEVDRNGKKRVLQFYGTGCQVLGTKASGATAADNEIISLYWQQGAEDGICQDCNISGQGQGVRVSRLCHGFQLRNNVIDGIFEHGYYVSQSNNVLVQGNRITNVGGNFGKLQIDNSGGEAAEISPTGLEILDNVGIGSGDNGFQINRTGDADASLYVVAPLIRGNVAVSCVGNSYRLSNSSDAVFKQNTYADSPDPLHTDSTFTTDEDNTLTAIARNDWSLGEMSGTTASDDGIGTTRNGSIGSAVTLGRGNHITQLTNRRAAMEFPDTTNGQVNVADWTLPTGDFSISMWVRSDDVSKQQYLFSSGDGSTTDYLHILFNGGDLEVRARRSNVTISCDDVTTTFEDNAWYCVVYTLTGTTRTLYVNAVDVTNTTTDTLGAVTGTAIGGFANDSNTNRFDGIMQDVVVYYGEMTSTEATSLFDVRIPSNALFHNDWNTLDDVTVSGSGVSVAGNVLTMDTTSSTSVATDVGALSTTERWFTSIAINPDGGSGYKIRIQLRAGSTLLCILAFDGTTLSLDTDGLSLTGVTPSLWDHDAEQKAFIVGDPATDTAYFWLLHKDTDGDDQYDYLGEISMADSPDRLLLVTGGTSGLTTITEPITIWKTSDVVASMGDSIATGSPIYSPVPRQVASSRDDQTSQVAFWYIDQEYPGQSKGIVNFGKGGVGSASVAAQTDWFIDLNPAMSLVWVGTNDINNAVDASDVIDDLDNIADDLLAQSLPLTFFTIIARPNAIDPDDHETERATVNSWIKTTGVSLGAKYIDADTATVDPTNNQLLQTKYDADTVHPTALGYFAAANYLSLRNASHYYNLQQELV